MDEHTAHRRPFEDRIPEDVRQHARAAREEMRESVKSFLPPEFWEHSKKARKEMLLAWRGWMIRKRRRSSRILPCSSQGRMFFI
jgi:hypothetical protein